MNEMKDVARRAVEEVIGRHRGCGITYQNAIPGVTSDKVRFYFGSWLGDIAYAVVPCTMSFPDLVDLRYEVQKEYTNALERKGLADEAEFIRMDLNGREIRGWK